MCYGLCQFWETQLETSCLCLHFALSVQQAACAELESVFRSSAGPVLGAVPANVRHCRSRLWCVLTRLISRVTLLFSAEWRFRKLDVTSNQLSGAIPSELGTALTKLVYVLTRCSVRLVYGCRAQPWAPSDKWLCIVCSTFNLQNNAFTGTIPTTFSSLTRLTYEGICIPAACSRPFSNCRVVPAMVPLVTGLCVTGRSCIVGALCLRLV